jgi:prevent-host-death family protein
LHLMRGQDYHDHSHLTMVMIGGSPMRTIPAGEFKAKCLALMDEVQTRGEILIITKRGKPVVRVTPLEGAATATEQRPIFGFMRGMATIVGDIVGPIIPAEEWSHLKDDSDPTAQP